MVKDCNLKVFFVVCVILNQISRKDKFATYRMTCQLPITSTHDQGLTWDRSHPSRWYTFHSPGSKDCDSSSQNTSILHLTTRYHPRRHHRSGRLFQRRAGLDWLPSPCACLPPFAGSRGLRCNSSRHQSSVRTRRDASDVPRPHDSRIHDRHE